MGRLINRGFISTKDERDKVKLICSDAVKIEDADVYWSHKNGAILVLASQEWKDYLCDRSDTPPVVKET